MMKRLFFSVLFFPYAALQATHLFEEYPLLRERIAHIRLGCFPTPVYRCLNLEDVLQHQKIFIKCDDMTGPEGLYGGNKVRKLEFLLGDALHKDAKKIVTFGCVGSNHAVATACYSHQLGLECLLMLTPQPESLVVCQNLLLDHYFGAHIEFFANAKERQFALKKLLHDDNSYYFFPTGGSVCLGVLGYVNAALELKAQVDQEILPMPDVIYVPVGSCGTLAGLLLGMQMTGMTSRVIAVTVEPVQEHEDCYTITEKLFNDANQMMHAIDCNIPLYQFPAEQFLINRQFCGNQYGQTTEQGSEALNLMQRSQNITLEGTYTAKAFAALMNDCQMRAIKHDQVVLFWNTYCGLDFSHLINTLDYHELPVAAYQYFNTNQM